MASRKKPAKTGNGASGPGLKSRSGRTSRRSIFMPVQDPGGDAIAGKLLAPLTRRGSSDSPSQALIHPANVRERSSLARSYRQSTAVNLPRTATVADALTAVFARGLHNLAHNALCLAGDDHPEIVHQMRVGLRRLRSFIRVCRPAMPATLYAGVRTRLSDLARPLGAARDLDVVIDDILKPAIRRMPDEPELRRLLDQTRAVRDQRYEDIRRQILAAPYFEAMDDLWVRVLNCDEARAFRGGESLDVVPIRDLAVRALKTQRKRLRKLGRHVRKMDADDRHRFRIAVKRHRYVAESCASIFVDAEPKRYIARLASMQKILGNERDVAMAGRILSDIAASHDHGDTGLAYGAGIIHGYHAVRANELEGKLLKQWKRFRKTKPFWRN